MCVEITIGTVKYPDVDHTADDHRRDRADCWIVHGAEELEKAGILNPGTFDHASKSADDFVAGLAAQVDAVPEGACKCIMKLVVYGHGTAGLGGTQTFGGLSAAGRALLDRLVFGEGARIEVRGCLGWSYAYHPTYIFHPELALLLTKNGGTYCSYRSYVFGYYPTEGAKIDQDSKSWTPGFGLHCAPIPRQPGMTLEEMKRLFLRQFSLADNSKDEVEALFGNPMGSVTAAVKAELAELEFAVEVSNNKIEAMMDELRALRIALEALQGDP